MYTYLHINAAIASTSSVLNCFKMLHYLYNIRYVNNAITAAAVTVVAAQSIATMAEAAAAVATTNNNYNNNIHLEILGKLPASIMSSVSVATHSPLGPHTHRI